MTSGIIDGEGLYGAGSRIFDAPPGRPGAAARARLTRVPELMFGLTAAGSDDDGDIWPRVVDSPEPDEEDDR